MNSSREKKIAEGLGAKEAGHALSWPYYSTRPHQHPRCHYYFRLPPLPPSSAPLSLSISICICIARLSHCSLSKQPNRTPKSSPRNAERKRSKPAAAAAAEASNGGGGPGLRGDRAAARPARRRRRGGGGQELLRQEGLRRDHRPEAEAGAGRRGGAGGGGSGRRGGRGRRRGEGGGARGGGHGRRRGQDEEVPEPEQRRHHRRAARPRREAARAQGAGGGVASGPVVPEEHPGGEVIAGSGGGVRQGEHGRRALPAQGGPQHVQDLPGPLQGPREDVQLLHHRKLWNSRDERHEREQADGSAQRIRVRSDIRGQGRRLDARRGCPVGDVRGVMQAPSDNEGIRSYWPCAKGDGEMQEQELRRGCTKCYARIKIPITLLAHPCIIFSVLSLSMYLLISEVILVCDLLFSSQSVPSLILLYT